MSAFLDTFFPHVSGVSYEELNGTRPCAEFGGEWHFICVSGGRGSMELDGVAYPLSAGHVVQMPAGRKSAMRSAAGGRLRYYDIRYRYVHVEWSGEQASLREPEHAPPPLGLFVQVPSPFGVLDQVRKMHRLWTEAGGAPVPGKTGKLNLTFLQLIHWLAEQQQLADTELTTKRSILECARYIERHYQEALERDALAKQFSISSSYFSVLFKKYLGCSPVQYITKVRMEKAMALLKESTKPVSVVALEVGYNDPLYFTRVFTRQVGVTPKQFREA